MTAMRTTRTLLGLTLGLALCHTDSLYAQAPKGPTLKPPAPPVTSNKPLPQNPPPPMQKLVKLPTIVNCIQMRLIQIPPGQFMMGSPKGESWHCADEKIHLVNITKAIYIGQTEVTQQQYQSVMGKNPSHFTTPPRGTFIGPYNLVADPNRPVADSLPVDSVSWNDAVEFCKRLSQIDKHPYRLPTEAEWEYACRAGNEDKFYCGDNDADLPYAAWIGGVSDSRTHPVARRRPNDWGLYDTLGNVYEWVADYYGNKYYNDSPKDDPQGPATGTERVIRGGAFNETYGNCRCGNRISKDPATIQSNVGFRVCFDAGPVGRKEEASDKAATPGMDSPAEVKPAESGDKAKEKAPGTESPAEVPAKPAEAKPEEKK